MTEIDFNEDRFQSFFFTRRVRMKVIKKINNNVALALNEKNEEYIIIGKGVGFKKTPYELNDHNIIEKIYVEPKNIKMFDVLNDIPIEDIYLAEKIIQAGKQILKADLNPNLILTLSDHISFAIHRSEEALFFRNPLEWDVKALYPQETYVGEKALEIIKTERNIQLPESEATFIALHFVNAQIDSGDMNKTTKITKIVSDILSIVKYDLKIDYDENMHNFSRFATHIRYFVIREMESYSFKNNNEEVYQMMKKKYTDTNACIEKIEKYLNSNYGWNCSNEEKLYLILHIERLKSKSK